MADDLKAARKAADASPPVQPVQSGPNMLTPANYNENQARAQAQVAADLESRDIDEGHPGGSYLVGGRLENGKRVGMTRVDADGKAIEDKGDKG